MSCLSVILSRIRGGIVSSARRINGFILGGATRVGGSTVAFRRDGGVTCSASLVCEIASTTRRTGGMTCRIGLVCGTSLGSGILWASDGRLITIDGGYLITA